MELNETLDNNFSDDFSDDLSINSHIRSYLEEIARWANFLAILGFIGLGLGFLFALGIGTMMGSMPEMGGAMLGSTFSIGYIFFMAIYLAIFIFPLLYLYRFASNTKKALRSDDQEALTLAFSNLKSHYKFIGIFTAIIMGLYLLIFVFALLGGGMAMMGM